MWTKLFRKRKMQSAMIFIIILLCTTLLNGSVTMLISLNKPYDNLKKACKSEAMKIYTYEIPDQLKETYKQRYENLDQVDHVDKVSYSSNVDDEIYMAGKKINSYIHMLQIKSNTIDTVRMIQGDKNITRNLKDDECMVPACIMNEYNLSVGDDVLIKNENKDIQYRIAAVYTEPYCTTTAYSSYLYVNKIPQEFEQKSYLSVFAKDGYTAKEIQDAYRDKYDGIFLAATETMDGVISEGLISIKITAAVFIAIGIIMLIVSGLIINFMVRNVMIADAKAVAIYKTIGYTTNDILNMYLTFYFVITLISSVIGIIGSKILATLILSGIYKNLGEVVNLNVIQTGIPCILIEIVFVLLICYLIINRTRRVKPIYALNGLQNTNSKKHKYHGNSNTSFSPWGIAIRNLIRDKRGIIGIVLTLIVTVFAVNFGMISIDVAFSQKDNNDYWIGVDASDVNVSISKVENYDEINRILQSDDRVEKSIGFYLDRRVFINNEETTGDSNIAAFIYENFDNVSLPVTEGRNPQESNEIAIASTFAQQVNKRPGDYLQIYIDDHTKVNLLVTGVFQTYYNLGVSCRMLTSTFTDHQLKEQYNTCSVYLKKGTDQAAFITDLQQRIGLKGNVIRRADNQASIMDMITQPQKMGIPPVIFLVFLISAVNIFCIIMLKNSDHAKINGIYKSIGYTTTDLITSNLIYVGILSVISFVVAIPVAILTYSDIMKLALTIFHFDAYPTTINVLHLILVNVAALIIFIVSTLLSSISIRHINVRDLVIE